jgi:hypothetical protein
VRAGERGGAEKDQQGKPGAHLERSQEDRDPLGEVVETDTCTKKDGAGRHGAAAGTQKLKGKRETWATSNNNIRMHPRSSCHPTNRKCVPCAPIAVMMPLYSTRCWLNARPCFPGPATAGTAGEPSTEDGRSTARR